MAYKQLLTALFSFLWLHNLQAQEHRIPDWAKSAVWYQIFPDRFRNGDTTNDPTLADIKGCWPHNDTAKWAVMPWGADWYAFQPWEQANGQDLNYNIQRRRYGGDLQGILDKLPYLDSLGVTALYLNPVFVAPSLHKYDAAMYHHIEPTFGPDPEGDKRIIAQEDPANPATWQWTAADRLALQLIDACHALGMHIIFDGVFNHMGVNSFAFQDVVKHQQSSPYKDWFVIDSWQDAEKGTAFSYTGWFGAHDLPEFREDSNGLVKGPRDYVFACTERWMAPDGDPQRGIDGWRLDVAFCVDMDFWRDWRAHVKAINPDSYLTAEINNDLQQVLPYVQGDAFDAVMHYGFAALCTDFFIQRRMSADIFMTQMQALVQAYPDSVAYALMNLLDSHDTPRFTSSIHNPHLVSFSTWGDFLRDTRSSNRDMDTRKPTDKEYQLQKSMAVFQFTMPGAPMVYYGDEAGMWGANDPDCRKPMVWPDIQYTPEFTESDGTRRDTPDSVGVNGTMLRHYQKLGAIRNTYPALQTGSLRIIPTTPKTGILLYERSLPGAAPVTIIINTGSRHHNLRLRNDDSRVTSHTDLLSGKHYGSRSGKMRIRIEEGEAMVLIGE